MCVRVCVRAWFCRHAPENVKYKRVPALVIAHETEREREREREIKRTHARTHARAHARTHTLSHSLSRTHAEDRRNGGRRRQRGAGTRSQNVSTHGQYRSKHQRAQTLSECQNACPVCKLHLPTNISKKKTPGHRLFQNVRMRAPLEERGAPLLNDFITYI